MFLWCGRGRGGAGALVHFRRGGKNTFAFFRGGAAQNTKITHCMIIFAINPLFASAGAIYLFKEKISWKWVLAYSLSFLGILQLVKHDFDLSRSSAFGNTSAVLAAVFYAGYVLTGKKARENVSNLSYISFVYFIAGLCFWVAAGFRQDSLIPQTNQAWLSIIGTILIPTLLGHGLFTYLITRMDLSLMTCGKLMEPMISSLPAFFIFQERPSAETFQAFILTSLGVLVLFFPWQKLIKS